MSCFTVHESSTQTVEIVVAAPPVLEEVGGGLVVEDDVGDVVVDVVAVAEVLLDELGSAVVVVDEVVVVRELAVLVSVVRVGVSDPQAVRARAATGTAHQVMLRRMTTSPSAATPCRGPPPADRMWPVDASTAMGSACGSSRCERRTNGYR
ncbi:hypothetical protein [Janibacter hoylei]|uniref:hypothetical protein n=1 Tax=Janibacter hoylei TaxID=364298 RepID=UPI0027BA6DCC|nr:hypothetical protein [Janibacter hoylei]